MSVYDSHSLHRRTTIPPWYIGTEISRTFLRSVIDTISESRRTFPTKTEEILLAMQARHRAFEIGRRIAWQSSANKSRQMIRRNSDQGAMPLGPARGGGIQNRPGRPIQTLQETTSSIQHFPAEDTGPFSEKLTKLRQTGRETPAPGKQWIVSCSMSFMDRLDRMRSE
jgi:hypothetical protein